MTRCPVCGHDVPEGPFCGACGAHLDSSSPRRVRAFAAAPSQHVLQPSVVTTLFPHLPRDRTVHYGLALGIGAIALALFAVLRLSGPGLALAGGLIPLVYLLYVYEVVAAEGERVRIIGLTFGFGVVLGLPWAWFSGPYVTHTVLLHAVGAASPGRVVVAGALLPLAAQALMLAGPFLLRIRRDSPGPVDLFAFGAASALGFAFATALVDLAPTLHRGPVLPAVPGTHTLTLLCRGLVIPFLDAGTTGLLAAVLGRGVGNRRRVPLSWVTSVPVVLAVVAVIRVAAGLGDVLIRTVGTVVVVDAVLAACLLIVLRTALHVLLLARPVSGHQGETVECPECGHSAPDMTYCPNCGVARAALPNRPAPGGRHLARRFGALAVILAAGAAALAVTAVFLSPSPRAACHALCAPPPPPCLACNRADAAPPLQTAQTYTSSAFGYSVSYTRLDPSQSDDRSVSWDLSGSTGGQYSVEVTAADARGRGPQDILTEVIDNNFQDFQQVYSIPGAEVGYEAGAGAVYDDEVIPFFGQASDSRLVVLTSVKKGVAIAVVGQGDASTDSGGHPDPSGLPVSSFVDSLTNGVRWSGDPPR